MITVLTFVRHTIGFRDQWDEVLTTTLVGLVMRSNTAEAVADVRIGPEDAQDVHAALDRRRDRSELNPAILCHRGDAGGEATAECGEHDLNRGGAPVF